MPASIAGCRRPGKGAEFAENSPAKGLLDRKVLGSKVQQIKRKETQRVFIQKCSKKPKKKLTRHGPFATLPPHTETK
jgi:hypothetical protein